MKEYFIGGIVSLSELLAAALFLVALGSAGCASHEDRSAHVAYGIEYRFMEVSAPRINRIHMLRVDLAGGKVKTSMVIADDPDGDGPAEVALTDPLKLASDPSVIAFINTTSWDSFPDKSGVKNRNWFEGQPVDIGGLAVSDGHKRSEMTTGFTSVWFDGSGNICIGGIPKEGTVIEGTAGFQQIVMDGKIIADKTGGLAPRTSIGVDREGKILWLVVVDGRQAFYSEGMTYQELAQFMLDLGCWNAVNMDGGGSSIMGIREKDGRLRVVNSPSDRTFWTLGLLPAIRPLPMVMTIKKTF